MQNISLKRWITTHPWCRNLVCGDMAKTLNKQKNKRQSFFLYQSTFIVSLLLCLNPEQHKSWLFWVFKALKIHTSLISELYVNQKKKLSFNPAFLVTIQASVHEKRYPNLLLHVKCHHNNMVITKVIVWVTGFIDFGN